MDVGADTAEFARYLRERGISDKVYSVEPYGESFERTKTTKALVEALPFKDHTFELVISHASIPNVLPGVTKEEKKENIRKALLEMIRVTKPGGEIRLGSVGKGDAYEFHMRRTEAFDEIIEELRQQLGFEYEEISKGETYETEEDGTQKILR